MKTPLNYAFKIFESKGLMVLSPSIIK
jgi:hypothetical protein